MLQSPWPGEEETDEVLVTRDILESMVKIYFTSNHYAT